MKDLTRRAEHGGVLTPSGTGSRDGVSLTDRTLSTMSDHEPSRIFGPVDSDCCHCYDRRARRMENSRVV